MVRLCIFTMSRGLLPTHFFVKVTETNDITIFHTLLITKWAKAIAKGQNALD